MLKAISCQKLFIIQLCTWGSKGCARLCRPISCCGAGLAPSGLGGAVESSSSPGVRWAPWAAPRLHPGSLAGLCIASCRALTPVLCRLEEAVVDELCVFSPPPPPRFLQNAWSLHRGQIIADDLPEPAWELFSCRAECQTLPKPLKKQFSLWGAAPAPLSVLGTSSQSATVPVLQGQGAGGRSWLRGCSLCSSLSLSPLLGDLTSCPHYCWAGSAAGGSGLPWGAVGGQWQLGVWPHGPQAWGSSAPLAPRGAAEVKMAAGAAVPSMHPSWRSLGVG